MENFDELLNESLNKIYVGDIVKCTVIQVSNSDLIVNMGYISDGIIPIDEINHSKEISLKELYSEGDTLLAKIIKQLFGFSYQ